MTEELYPDIDKYYFDDISNVILINVVRITEENQYRLDLLIRKYYSNLDYLNLILSFNNITDVTEIKIGTLFKLPNIESMLSELIVLDADDESIVQGINPLIFNKNNIQKNNKNNKTTANPKLNITLPKVSYDSNNGIITY